MKLQKLRLLLKASLNPAIQQGINSPEAKQFRSESVRALNEQVAFTLKEENLNQIRGMDKMQKFDIDPTSIIAKLLAAKSFGDLAKTMSFQRFASTLGGQIGLNNIGVKVAFNIKDPLLIAQLEDADNFLIQSVDSTTVDWLARNIPLQIDAGLSNAEIAKLIAEEFQDISLTRAELIVNAELANASALTEELVYRKNGVRRWRWVTTGDGRVTDECRENESVGFIRIGDPFPNGPNNIRSPRFPRCRCHMEPDTDSMALTAVWAG